ncbi:MULTISPECIES: hypothetical protein [Amycolatopsis]|uniref:hypothetical protein n=1 Tax=Amycolatopsis TaxID=1813 RepID=UPI001E49E795|nr:MULTISPECIES: hypothetical protein [Amycolatopsis]
MTGRSATYDIDTDLYDISLDDQREFAEEIERDIVEFLGSLRAKAVLRGNDGSNSCSSFQGRFMASVRTCADLAAGRAGGEFVPVE